MKTIQLDEMPQEIKDALKELSSILGKTADASDAYTKFKKDIGKALAEAVIESGVEPLKAVQALQVLAAITLTSHYDAKEGVDERKAFGKLSKLAYDHAMMVKAKVDSKGE